jgi:HK97 family phage major capsid protein
VQLLETLRAQFTETQEAIRALTDEIAGNEGAAATDEQAANLATLNDGLESLGPRIEQAAGMANRMRGAAELLGGVPGDLDTTLNNVRRTPIAREWDSFGAYARALAAGEVDDTTRADIARMVNARERRRAFADVTTPDVPGLLPPQWLTDIVDFIGTARPFITAYEQRPLPDTGMAINYPSITARPQVGKQATEKTDIPSRKTTVGSGVANVQTFGGGEDVSIQVLQRTDPAYLGLMLELYAEEMAAGMDATAIATAFAAIPVGNHVAVDNANIAGAFVEAAQIVFAARGVLDAAVIGLNLWAGIAGAVDSAGRPLFPNVSPMNPMGASNITDPNASSVRGLTLVVDPWMDPNQGVVGWSRAFTSMTGGVQTLSADNPSKLGRDYAVYEFAAFAVRRPDALVALAYVPPVGP